MLSVGDLWRDNRARLIVFSGETSHTYVIDCPATVVVDGRWLTLQGGEVRSVGSVDGTWRHATAEDVNTLPPLI